MTTLVDTERITISPENVREAQAAVGAPHLAPLKLVLQAQDGSVISLPDHIENILLRTLQAVADDRHVAIGQLPRHLTSNAAADVLGVSRPTLMKWAKDGRIPSTRVGTHARFDCSDVMRLKKELSTKRAEALGQLREFDSEHLELDVEP